MFNLCYRLAVLGHESSRIRTEPERAESLDNERLAACHFDEIKTFGRFYEGLFCIWQNFEPTLQNIRKVIGQIFIVVNGQILN